MRLLHTSDWHLGRTLHGVDLLDAQRAVLAELCAVVADPPDGVPVDVVLVAGDVYDRAVPPVEAVGLLSQTLAELTRHATVVVTSGNHDSAIRLGFGSGLFTDRLHLRTSLSEIGSPLLVGDVALYALPYLDPDVARTALAPGTEALERSHAAVMSAALDRVRADLSTRPSGTRSVVAAHAFVVGGVASDSERPIAVGGVDSVPASVFDGIDYVALGHLHGAQQVGGSPTLRYSGSPLRYSFSERGHRKSLLLVDIDDGPVRVTEVPLTQPRGMADLTGMMEELLHDTRFGGHDEDWVRVTVTDRTRPDSMFERIRSRFPHALQVFHVPAGAATAGSGPMPAARTPRPEDLMQDFLRHVTGIDGLPGDAEYFAVTYHAAASELDADQRAERRSAS